MTDLLPRKAPSAPPTPQVLQSRRFRHLPQYLAISPFYVLFLVFGAYPVFSSLYLALQRWDGIGPMEWVGLENFALLVTDAEFWNAIGNTFII